MLFANKPQYLAIMNLIGKAFNCNLSKTKHNFSKAAGYNSARDLEMLIPDSTPNFAPVKAQMTDLADHFLLGVVEFDYVKPLKGRWGDTRFNVVGLKAPRIVKLILDGSFSVLGTKWANVQIEATSVIDGINEFRNRTMGEEILQIAELSIVNTLSDTSIPLVALEQRVSPELVVDTTNLSREMLVKLIQMGSLEQYNAITKDIELINKHDLASELLRRYIYQLDTAHDGYSAQNSAEHFPWAIYLDESEVDRFKSLTQLMPPPIEVITFENFKDIAVFGDGLYYNVIEDLLCYSEDFHAGFSDLIAAHESGDKNYVMNDVGAAIVRHSQFILECCAIQFVTDNMTYDADLSIITQLCFDLPLNWASKPIRNFLEFVPVNSKYQSYHLISDKHDIYKSDEQDWSGLPMAAVIAIQAIDCSRAQTQHVFSSMSDSTLALEVETTGILSGLPSKVSIADILKIGLKG